MRTVIKVGGSVLEEQSGWVQGLQELAQAGDEMIVVHGGGARISEVLRAQDEPVTFWKGQRVTSAAGLRVVVGVLSGEVNTDLVLLLKSRGLAAVGLSGTDAGLLQARMVEPALGRVGQVEDTNPALLRLLLNQGYVPVVAPLAIDAACPEQCLNVNGDWAAAHIAAAVHADRLVFYTDVGGVRRDPADPATTVAQLDSGQCRRWIVSGVAADGMVPKLEAAVFAVEHGVADVCIGPVTGGTLGTRVVWDHVPGAHVANL